ncbi:MAG: hypothetical protein LBC88_06355 [Spirochaetaceae bacterium]|jgi:hypothetical protein|nr:hypothetical protein [Spirochaetaceae bacterium]
MRRVFFLPVLFAAALSGFAQTERPALALTQDDFWILRDPRGGFHLYVRKTGAVQSVLIAADRLTAGAGGSALFILEPNNVNGAEVVLFPPGVPDEAAYYLTDSSAEYYPPLGAEAFHVYLPRHCFVYSGSLAPVPVPVTLNEGVTVLVRSFELAGVNPDGVWQDTPLTLRASIRPWSTGTTSMAHPMTLGISGRISVFNPGPDDSSNGYLNPDFPFSSTYTPGGALSFTHHLSTYMGYSAIIEHDPVLATRLILRGLWDWELLSLELGGFLGAGDMDTFYLNPGLSMLFKFKLPQGIFELTIQLDSSLGRELRGPGDFRQDMYDIHLITVIPYFRIDANLNSRAVTISPSAGSTATGSTATGSALISNHWTRYETAFIFTGKNAPFNAGLAGGYQDITWGGGALRPSRYRGVFAGARLFWRAAPTLELFLSADTPLFPFDYVTDPYAPSLFTIEGGFRWAF